MVAWNSNAELAFDTSTIKWEYCLLDKYSLMQVNDQQLILNLVSIIVSIVNNVILESINYISTWKDISGFIPVLRVLIKLKLPQPQFKFEIKFLPMPWCEE